MEDLVDLAAELIAVRSTADRPADLARALEFTLGVVGPGFTVERFESHGKPSALVRTEGSSGPFRVLLNAHLDVVPGADEQFTPRRDGQRLYGRGAQDMKVAAVVMASVFREVARAVPYPLGLQLVTDEEVGGFDGTGHQVDSGVRAGFVVIGEQSRLEVVTESKGLAHVRLRATGRAAHAAYPWLGENAVLAVVAGIGRLLERYPAPAEEAWRTTANVARIETGNQAINQVPAEAEAWVDIRFPPEDGDFDRRTKQEVAEHLREVTGVDVEVRALGAPHRADPDSDDVGQLRQVVRDVGFPGTLLRKHGAADGRFYYARGIDAVIFGPGGDGQHGPEEYADLTTVEPYRQALTAFLRTVSPRWR
ncbi:M20 family metallopeptidase [Paractinoplanes atraurantiacus]|uniref:Succinyl-diaminopimelate desuccinylase n=1 Tax=Paractinoplanes atraurantiacus TaxID=1036182 RepID=A0A285IL61_9ACTN|nr:M20/M25/M40 family metallo-hydrolase [Actinoplanes atraurantiacus]SNY48719.1 succinyl-diaminopimelate desuccinylase [Actinoplanes atraurantiacus]